MTVRRFVNRGLRRGAPAFRTVRNRCPDVSPSLAEIIERDGGKGVVLRVHDEHFLSLLNAFLRVFALRLKDNTYIISLLFKIVNAFFVFLVIAPYRLSKRLGKPFISKIVGMKEIGRQLLTPGWLKGLV